MVSENFNIKVKYGIRKVGYYSKIWYQKVESKIWYQKSWILK